MQEKTIEKKYVEAVKAKGGLCIKLYSPWFTGLPDRLNLLPGARIWFTEFKYNGGKLSARQVVVKGILEGLGFRVIIINEHNIKEEISYI